MNKSPPDWFQVACSRKKQRRYWQGKPLFQSNNRQINKMLNINKI